ncbi:hypothetical protein [Salinarimonas ramus]|uniref:hypothetical protein n=1 Tax=Salinarimonas ramus TaxID=690164 RepID=UPI0016631EDE|nr:hypothetical protein [Salinarimonas ramus]
MPTALWRALALGALAGFVVFLRIVERGEALSPRTWLVVAIFAASGALAAFTVSLLAGRFAPNAPRLALGAATGLVLVPCTVFAFFAFDRNAGDILWSLREYGLLDTLGHAMIGLTIDAAGAFSVTARPYLLPWPIVALGLGAAAAFAPGRRRAALAGIAVAVLAGFGVDAARAQGSGAEPDAWSREKCARYATAWEEATTRMGREGLSAEFVTRHDAFVASGCLADADVCPRSEAELAMANVLVILAMNAGMASTFPPFACRG